MMKKIASDANREAHCASLRALVIELSKQTVGLPTNIQFTQPIQMWPGVAESELITGMHTCATDAHQDHPDGVANNLVLSNGWAEWTSTCIYDAEDEDCDADVTQRLQLLIKAVENGEWTEADDTFAAQVAQLDNMTV